MTRKETNKRDTLLRNLLFKHKGFENAIKTKDICADMRAYGYKIQARSLPNIIKRLRKERGLPISYAREKGYFIAISKSDIQRAIADMELQINALQTTINFMKGFYLE